MAIYHLHAKMVQRNKGQSAVAAAAYRSGSLLIEETTGITHDYNRKRGVEHSEILAPDGASSWVFDRQTLWNLVEQAERRKDAQVAREIEVGLPVELSKSEQVALLRDYVEREFVTKGMVADLGLHRDNPVNPHAHILLTTRDLTPDGFGQKNRAWNDKAHLLQWRRAAATDDFGGRSGAPESEVRALFIAALSRARPKELAHDYLEREAGSDAALVSRLVVREWEKDRSAEHKPSTMPAQLKPNDLDAKQQTAAERWASRQKNPPAKERGNARSHGPAPNYENEHNIEPGHGLENDLDL